MNTKNKRPLTSIIIPCSNQHKFTRQCVRALKTHTLPPWELIVIDNGSTDRTPDYLTGVQDGATVPVTVITNKTNRGFPAAINQGLKVARGEHLVLLNNDVVLTDSWLEQLIALADMGTEKGKREDTVAGCSGPSPPDPLHSEACDAAPPDSPLARGGKGSFEDMVAACSGSTPPGRPRSEACVAAPPGPFQSEACVTTPPGPPLSRGGKGYAGGIDGVGLVGPMSNYASPPQLVESVPYHDMPGMHAFARQWRKDHRGKRFTAHKLSGFCLLMKRAVYESIGGLDERFGIGFFDDDDLAERARRAGFELAVAHDLFVHHFGSRTFHGQGIDINALLDANSRRFADKWGGKAAAGKPIVLSPWPVFLAESQREFARQVDEPVRPGETPAHTNGAVPAARAVKVSLVMIVRDEQANLPRCLGPVRGVFDEIVVVDTGSVDRTKEIALSFGAKVIDSPWVDSFAAARNEGLLHATGGYAFCLDADDVVEPGELEKLKALFLRLRIGDAVAYVVRCACDPSPDGSYGGTVVDHVRLFPLRADVRWTYRVHEQILPALRRAKVPVRWSDVTVRHTGYNDPALRSRKLDRDIRRSHLDLADRPNDPFILFNLGSIAGDRREWCESLGYLERSLAGSAPGDSIVRKLYALIARAHQSLGDTQQALAACAKELELDREDAELWFRKGVLHRHRGERAEAERAWRRILGLRRPEQFCSFNQAIYGHLTRRNLAGLAAERGDGAEATRLWEAVLAECPGDREALARLGRALAPHPFGGEEV